MDKLNEYTGGYWRVQAVKDAWREWKERRRGDSEDPSGAGAGAGAGARTVTGRIRDWLLTRAAQPDGGDYSHVYRSKTRAELLRISAAVMGIEFCYAAETAFVSPTLLSIGVLHSHMTLIWCLSPLVGFFLTPVLGSMSDRCRSPLGRRRPFILLLSVGIVLGLLLVPNGSLIGRALGDEYPPPPPPMNLSSAGETDVEPEQSIMPTNLTYPLLEADAANSSEVYHSHPWGIFFTIVGTVLLDFDSDACQSPARAFLLDITIPEDHTRGLSTFTINAGLGGALGYVMGGINWDATFIGELFGGHVRAVFTLVLFLFLGCLMATMCSFPEIPLDLLHSQPPADVTMRNGAEQEVMMTVNPADGATQRSYGTVANETSPTTAADQETSFMAPSPTEAKAAVPEPEEPRISLKEYLLSIVYMPASLRVLCLTNLFCWMSLVCYSLYFTDFVGEAVFGGDPQAPVGTPSRKAYEDGVRFGCWGMAIYSLSCSIYSFLIENLVRRFRARPVYVGGQLVYAVGMVFMASLRHRVAVIVFSACAGVMYSTLFTMPYLLVAHYHVSGSFTAPTGSEGVKTQQVRGLGTDVAIVSSMVFLAQFVLSLCVGSIVTAAGTTTMVVVMAAVLSTCGAITATQVTYLDL